MLAAFYYPLSFPVGTVVKALGLAEMNARKGGFVDLEQYVRLSEAELVSGTGGSVDVRSIEEVLKFAHQMGLAKLEADACKVSAENSLRVGDVGQAGRLARIGIGIAARNGMRIRVTAFLVLLGRIAAKAQRSEMSLAMLESAIARAKAQGYHLQVQVGERVLRAIREGSPAPPRG